MGELDPDQATVLSEALLNSAAKRNTMTGLRKEELAELRSRSSLKRCARGGARCLPSTLAHATGRVRVCACVWFNRFEAHRSGIAGETLASKFAMFRAMSVWG